MLLTAANFQRTHPAVAQRDRAALPKQIVQVVAAGAKAIGLKNR